MREFDKSTLQQDAQGIDVSDEEFPASHIDPLDVDSIALGHAEAIMHQVMSANTSAGALPGGAYQLQAIIQLIIADALSYALSISKEKKS